MNFLKKISPEGRWVLLALAVNVLPLLFLVMGNPGRPLALQFRYGVTGATWAWFAGLIATLLLTSAIYCKALDRTATRWHDFEGCPRWIVIGVVMGLAVNCGLLIWMAVMHIQAYRAMPPVREVVEICYGCGSAKSFSETADMVKILLKCLMFVVVVAFLIFIKFIFDVFRTLGNLLR